MNIIQRCCLVALLLAAPFGASAQISTPAPANAPAPAAPQPATRSETPLASTPASEAAIVRRSHMPPLDPSNPYSAKITDAAADLASQLNDHQASAFAHVRVNFGKMGAVRTVANEVERAVRSCDRANPAQTTAMDAAFRDWRTPVGTALAEQQQHLVRTVRSGIAGDPRKIMAYLDLIDKAANYAAQRQSAPPPTAAPACAALQASMARTQPTLTALLAQLDWPAFATQAAQPPHRAAAQLPGLPRSLPPLALTPSDSAPMPPTATVPTPIAAGAPAPSPTVPKPPLPNAPAPNAPISNTPASSTPVSKAPATPSSP